MKYIKKAVLFGLIGLPIGVFIGTTITLIFIAVDGNSFANFGYLLRQYIIDCIIGFVFASVPVVFTIENWSRLKQTAIHFLVIISVSLPCAFIGGWIPFNPVSVAVFVVIFIVAYLCYWFGFYFYWKHKIKRINAAIACKR